MNDYREWITLREIDLALGLTKGSAFRAFKSIAAELAEGTDFLLLQAAEHRAEVENLRAAGRIYAGSVNVILLSAPVRERVAALAL